MRDTPLSVLLVEDNPGDARLLTVGLAEEAGDAFNIEWVQDLSTALEHLSADVVDAILLDLNLPDSEGFDTFARMQAAAPEVPILVLTGLEDDTIGLKAIQQGAQDYLGKADLTGSAVARALRYAVERHRSRVRELRNVKASRRGKVIGFIGAKGGVGTTSVVLSVAGLVAKNTHRPVAAVELRSDYGSFAAYLHESPTHTLGNLLKMNFSTLTDSVLDKCTFKSRLGFDVLFSPQKPQEFRLLQPEDARHLMDRLAHRAFYTLIDLPSRYSPVTETVLQGCDLTLLITERDPASLAAAKVALSFLAKRESGPAKVGLVVVNRSLMLDGTSPRQIEAALGCELLGVVPPAPDVSVSAQRFGTPMALHRPLSAPANMLNAITKKIIARLEAPGPVERVLQSVPA